MFEHFSRHVAAGFLITGIAVFSGCKKDENAGGSSTSGSSSNSSASASVDPNVISGQGEKEAVGAMRAELESRWVKTSDGWTSEYPSKVYIATGKRASAESYYRQVKTLNFAIEPDELSESNKLNGTTFHGVAHFNEFPLRVYNDPSAFGPPRWSEWRTASDSIFIEKKNGKWLFAGMNFLDAGAKPTPGALVQLK